MLEYSYNIFCDVGGRGFYRHVSAFYLRFMFCYPVIILPENISFFSKMNIIKQNGEELIEWTEGRQYAPRTL